MGDDLFFSGWEPLVRTAAMTVLGYAGMVVLLRVSGHRTLSKMNAFDQVVTIALGSTLASLILTRSVSLSQGLLAILLLIALQYVLTWLSVRLPRVRRMIGGEPVLLLHRGHFLGEAMRRARVSRDEILACVRQDGRGSLQEVQAVVLETNGTISVIRTEVAGPQPALAAVPDADR